MQGENKNHLGQYYAMNGWTKARMISHIKENFKGKSTEKREESANYCLYRGPEGRKCAVGMFMPDSVYNSSLEGKSATAQEVKKAMEGHNPISFRGMDDLQGIHDNSLESETLYQLLSWVERNVVDP